jgi:hypothetical protein
MAAQISDNFRQIFYHILNIGCKGAEIFDAMHAIIIEQLARVIPLRTLDVSKCLFKLL